MNIGIIGLGLIGGSMGLDLKKRGFATKIFGVDKNIQHANIAMMSNLVEEIATLEQTVQESDLVIVATPIDATKIVLPEVLNLIGDSDKVVTDVGSTKAGISELIADHSNRHKYVASHPMAGTEFSGPLAAISNLFDYKNAIICDKDQSSESALKIVREMYEALNMKLIFMESHEHDISAAYVSHMSHISSFALSLAVLEKEKDEAKILNLASGGFASTVRLAKSSAEMWAPIFEQNSEYVLEVLDTYIDKLNMFKESIINNEHQKLVDLIKESNKIQKIL